MANGYYKGTMIVIFENHMEVKIREFIINGGCRNFYQGKSTQFYICTDGKLKCLSWFTASG